ARLLRRDALALRGDGPLRRAAARARRAAEGGGMSQAKGEAKGLGGRALLLGAANAFDYAMQFLLPAVLARCLDAASFGQYRLLWLAIATVMAIAPLGIPQGLFYYLPRANAAEKRLYVHHSLLWLGLAGLIAAWAVSSLNPFLPGPIAKLGEYGALIPA